MGRKLGKNVKLLVKVFLLIQLYYFHNLEVDAVHSTRENLEICNERHHFKNGTYFDDVTEKNLQRNKRPARMIPVQYLFNKEKNSTKDQNIVDNRFYGPASNCVEISKLGYTLNGYYLVKGKNQAKNDQLEVLGCRFKHPDGTKKVKEERIGFIDIKIVKSMKRRSQEEPFTQISLEEIENVENRPKRPARLLPKNMIFGKPKNNTEKETDSRFYGPATNCEELKKLGYTLNGLYLVDAKDESKKGKIEVIECRFKQPQGSKEAKEERIGFVNSEAKKTKTIQRRHLSVPKETPSSVIIGRNRRIIKRPGRLLPLQLLYGKEKNDTEVVERFYGPAKSCSELGKLGYTLNGYYLVNGAASGHQIEISLCKFRQPLGVTDSFKEERFVLGPKKKLLPLDHGRNESYPLMNNETGKCLDADSNYARTIETDCNLSTIKRWKLLNNGKQLCDENSAECLSGEVSDDARLGPNYVPWPSLFPMLRDQSGNKNCINFWEQNKKTQHVSA